MKTMAMSKSQPGTISSRTASPEFERVFEQQWEQVCRTLYQITGDPAEAEDLAMETFLQLYQRPPANQENLAGWLYRVAVNLGLNSLRAGKRRSDYESRLAFEDEPNAGPDPSRLVEQAQEREQVRAALSSMKSRSAELLVLRSAGLSYREIAAAFGLAPGSIGTLLARAEIEFHGHYRKYQSATEPGFNQEKFERRE